MIARFWPLLAAVVLATCSTDVTMRGPQGQTLGRVCASGVVGERIDPIHDGRGCRVSSPVKVYQVRGIDLSRPAVMDCSAARALRNWVRGGVERNFDQPGAKVTKMVVYDDYNCRRVNGGRSGKMSQHARAKAIDIGEFILEDGRRVTLLKHWNSREFGPVLRRLHRAACGPFGTVLGPSYNRAHANHFHFDTDSYGRGSKFCR